MDSLPELTARQRQVFEFIESKIQEWGYPPFFESWQRFII